jgi:hypothetical protein
MARNTDPTSRRSRAAEKRRRKAEAEARKREARADKAVVAIANEDKGSPNQRVQELRNLFSFAQVPVDKRIEGRNGEVDSYVSDTIGRLAACGLFDGHGLDPWEMVRIGRFWGGYIASKAPGRPKVGAYERRDKGEPTTASAPDDLFFEKIDDPLWITGKEGCRPTYERTVLWELLVIPELGERQPIWAQLMIDDDLFRRGRFYSGMCVGQVSAHDRDTLHAAIRGLCLLVDGALPQRWAA